MKPKLRTYPYSEFSPEVKAATPRFKIPASEILKLENILYDREMGILFPLGLDHEVQDRVYANSSRFVSLVDIDVDKQKVGFPVHQLSFSTEYEAYKKRLYPEDSEYAAMVEHMAARVISRLDNFQREPDFFVMLPTRKETKTSLSCDVIRQDCRESGLTPFILVLHNDVEDPHPITVDDLNRIRGSENCLVIDLKVSKAHNIGEIRAILADIMLEVNHQMGWQKLLVLADADIMALSKNFYATLINPLQQDPEVDLCVASLCLLSESAKNDLTYYLLQEIANFERKSVQKYLPPQAENSKALGSCTVVRPLRLVLIGGIPRVNVAEDHLLGKKIQKHRNSARNNQGGMVKLCWTEAEVFVSADRHAFDFRNAVSGDFDKLGGGSRYSNWEKSARALRPTIKKFPVEKDRVIQRINEAMMHIINGEQKEKMNSWDYLLYMEESIEKYTTLCKDYGIPLNQVKLRFN